MTLTTILCPLDFSAASEQLVAYAAVLARATGAALRLLHVREQQLVLMEAGLEQELREQALRSRLPERRLAARGGDVMAARSILIERLQRIAGE